MADEPCESDSAYAHDTAAFAAQTEELRQLRSELTAALPRLARAEAELRQVTEELAHTRQQLEDSWDQLRSLRRSATYQLAAGWRRLGRGR